MTRTEHRTLAERLSHISDPARRWAVTKRTARLYLTLTEASLTVDEYRRAQYADHIDRIDAPTTDAEYAVLMERVRQTAIAEHENSRFGSNNCHEGTQAFLEAFGFEPAECCDDAECTCSECVDTEVCTREVTVTMTMRLTIRNSATNDDIENDVTNYLRVDAYTGHVDDVIDSSDVTITGVDVTE